MDNDKQDEIALRRTCRHYEQHIDETTLSRLSEARKAAVSRQSRHFMASLFSNQPLFSAIAVSACLIVVFNISPDLPVFETEHAQQEAVEADPMLLLMEDPEFYLWLSESSSLIVEL